MRRTAAWLTLPLYLAVALGEEYEPAPFGEGWRSRATGESVDSRSLRSRHALDLLPMLLIVAACVGRAHPAQPVSQAVGTFWLLALVARLLLSARRPEILLWWAFPFLGMAFVSLLECLVFPRRPPSPDAPRRFTVALLAILAVEEAKAAWNLGSYYLSMPSRRFVTTDEVLRIPLPLGIIATFLLTAWGLQKGTRWAPWVGCVATACLFGATLWEFGSILVLRPEFRGGTLWFYLIGHFPAHLLQAAAALLLGIRIRRDRSRHEAPANR